VLRVFIGVMLAQWIMGADCTPRAGYIYCRPLTIDHTKVVNTNQSNFPQMVSRTVTEWKTTANGGHIYNTTTLNSVTVPADLVFTSDIGGTSLLAGWEIINYTASTGAIILFANIGTNSASSDTVFYASYGAPSVTTYQATASATWDTNYAGVWHLEDNAANTNLVDSTSNGTTETLTGGNSSVFHITGGEVGSAQDFGVGATSYAFSATQSVAAFPVTISGFMQRSAFTGGMVFAAYAPTQASTGGYWAVNSPLQFFDSLVGNDCVSGTNFTTGIWNYFAVSGTANNGGTGACYVGRVGTDTTLHRDTGTTANISGTPTIFQLGLGSTAQGQFNGQLDEIRWSKVVRSADYLGTEYNSLTTPAMITVGTEVVGNLVTIGAIAQNNPIVVQ
jgi:hypothetical protein